MRLLLFGSAVVECIREGADKERPASATWVKHYRVAIHPYDSAHEVNYVVWRKRLVFVGLPDVFVEGCEEEVEKILSLCRLVVDVGKDAIADEVENLLKLLLFQFTDALRINNLCF